MASGGEARQKGVEELEKEVTCPVCHDHFQEPKILPCLHYYCKQCIQALAWRAGANQPFPCPECRTDTFLPQDDPDQLPTAFFVNRMKEVHSKLEKVQGRVDAKCEMCSGGVASAFCRQCAEFICDKCTESHQRMKMFTGHKVSTLEELKEGGARDIVVKPTPPPTCKVHGEQAKIYCYDCKSLICRDCIVKDHKEYEYEFVKKAAPETKKKLMEQLTPLNEIQVGTQKAVKNVEETKLEIGEMGEHMTASIKRSFQELRDIINKQEKELLAETAVTVEQKMNKLSIQQKKLEMSSGTIRSLVEFVERSIENATDEELLTMHTQMMTRIREEMEKQQQAEADLVPVEDADKAVVVECADELKKQCQDNARIITLPVSLTVENVEAIVGQLSQVIIQLDFEDGRPIRKRWAMEATLTSKVSGSCQQAKVVWKQGNSYQIEFTPTVRGRHQLEVVYNDTPVLGGPVEIFVTIPPSQLGKPARSIAVGKTTKFTAFNSSEELLVTAGKEEVVAFDKSGKKLYSITDKALSPPNGIAVGGSNIYVTVSSKHSLVKLDKTGKVLRSVGREGSGEGEFNQPCEITVVGDEVFICDHRNHRLQVFTSDLVFVRQFGTKGSGKGEFECPGDVAHDEGGNLYVTDYVNERVQVFNAQGKFLNFLTTPGDITKPTGINISRELVYVSQFKKNGQLFVYNKNGHKVCSFTCKSGGDGIWGIAIDKDGFIYLCDPVNCKVTVY